MTRASMGVQHLGALWVTQLLLAHPLSYLVSPLSHGCPRCEGRNRVKQADLWSGDPREPCSLPSAPCLAFSDRNLDLGFLPTLHIPSGGCSSSWPASATAALCVCGVFPPVLSPDVTVAKLTVSWPYSSLAVSCAFGPISCFLSSMLQSTGSPETWNTPPLPPAAPAESSGWRLQPWHAGAGLKPRVSLCSRRLAVPAFIKPPPFYNPSSL